MSLRMVERSVRRVRTHRGQTRVHRRARLHAVLVREADGKCMHRAVSNVRRRDLLEVARGRPGVVVGRAMHEFLPAWSGGRQQGNHGADVSVRVLRGYRRRTDWRGCGRSGAGGDGLLWGVNINSPLQTPICSYAKRRIDGNRLVCQRG